MRMVQIVCVVDWLSNIAVDIAAAEDGTDCVCGWLIIQHCCWYCRWWGWYRLCVWLIDYPTLLLILPLVRMVQIVCVVDWLSNIAVDIAADEDGTDCVCGWLIIQHCCWYCRWWGWYRLCVWLIDYPTLLLILPLMRMVQIVCVVDWLSNIAVDIAADEDGTDCVCGWLIIQHCCWYCRWWGWYRLCVWLIDYPTLLLILPLMRMVQIVCVVDWLSNIAVDIAAGEDGTDCVCGWLIIQHCCWYCRWWGWYRLCVWLIDYPTLLLILPLMRMVQIVCVVDWLSNIAVDIAADEDGTDCVCGWLIIQHCCWYCRWWGWYRLCVWLIDYPTLLLILPLMRMVQIVCVVDWLSNIAVDIAADEDGTDCVCGWLIIQHCCWYCRWWGWYRLCVWLIDYPTLLLILPLMRMVQIVCVVDWLSNIAVDIAADEDGTDCVCGWLIIQHCCWYCRWWGWYRLCVWLIDYPTLLLILPLMRMVQIVCVVDWLSNIAVDIAAAEDGTDCVCGWLIIQHCCWYCRWWGWYRLCVWLIDYPTLLLILPLMRMVQIVCVVDWLSNIAVDIAADEDGTDCVCGWLIIQHCVMSSDRAIVSQVTHKLLMRMVQIVCVVDWLSNIAVDIAAGEDGTDCVCGWLIIQHCCWYCRWWGWYRLCVWLIDYPTLLLILPLMRMVQIVCVVDWLFNIAVDIAADEDGTDCVCGWLIIQHCCWYCRWWGWYRLCVWLIDYPTLLLILPLMRMVQIVCVVDWLFNIAVDIAADEDGTDCVCGWLIIQHCCWYCRWWGWYRLCVWLIDYPTLLLILPLVRMVQIVCVVDWLSNIAVDIAADEDGTDCVCGWLIIQHCCWYCRWWGWYRLCVWLIDYPTLLLILPLMRMVQIVCVVDWLSNIAVDIAAGEDGTDCVCGWLIIQHCVMSSDRAIVSQGLALLTLSWDKILVN